MDSKFKKEHLQKTRYSEQKQKQENTGTPEDAQKGNVPYQPYVTSQPTRQSTMNRHYAFLPVDKKETVISHTVHEQKSPTTSPFLNVETYKVASIPNSLSFPDQVDPFQIEQQETAHSIASQQPAPLFARKVLKFLPKPVRFIVIALLTRMLDAHPESASMSSKSFLPTATSQTVTLGWFPVIALVSAVGLFVSNYAYNLSRLDTNLTANSLAQVEFFFMLGLILIFVPIVLRLLTTTPSRVERICLLCFAGVSLYFIQLTNDPLHFSNFNEFLHWRTASDIAKTGHLYSDNTMLPVSPYYPGLEIITNALSSLSGLDVFQAGMMVLGIARITIILSLFLLYEQVTQSSRMAGIATIIYMTNPHFISFDVQFSYESIALPLATFMLFAVARLETLPHRHALMTLVACLTFAAIAISHHVTDYVFDGLLFLWVITYRFQHPIRARWPNLVTVTLFGIGSAIAVAFLVPGNPVVDYLSSYFGGALKDLGHVLSHSGQARQLFVNYSGISTPLWDRLLLVASIGIITLSLPPGLLSIWLRHHRKGLALMLSIAALAYPVSQAFRFTNFGSEITDRSAAFLFIPIAYVLSVLITQFWPTQRLRRGHIAFITTMITILFLGGVILQAGPGLSFLPGSYLVEADNRSIDAESIQGAIWTLHYLGPGNRIATDRDNRLLMSTYGDQYVITNLDNKVDTSPVFLNPTLGSNEIELLRLAHVQYLAVDLRLSTSMPFEGFYFEDGEPGSFTRSHPVPRSALTKFDKEPRVNRVFDSGDIVIYSVGGLVNAS